MENQNVIVQLNNYPKDRYNVLVPVTTMQAASNMQRITVSEVQLDTNKDTTKDIYYEKSSGKYAITKVAGMKLAAAANISIVDTDPTRTEGCQRCIEMARATGKARVCGTCEHNYDVAVTAIIRVPEPSGGFRMMKATKEIDCTMEKSSMTEAQYKRFLPHRTAIAESKAFMRAIRAALGLSGTYELAELRKPFIIARIVPNLDAPEMRDAVAANYLQSMGMLYEMPARRQGLPPAQPVEAIPEFDDEKPGQLAPAECLPEPDDAHLPWETQQPQNGIWCEECGQEIVETTARNGKVWSPEAIKGYSEKAYGRCLCTVCQQNAKGGR